jgi:DNA-binding protein H-NS
MARGNSYDKMSYSELTNLESEIARLKTEKQSSERAALKEKLTAMAKDAGFDINELFAKARKGKGSVPPKYRDPKNPENTWTGRGRPPRWLAAAMKTKGVKKEDFLI